MSNPSPGGHSVDEVVVGRVGKPFGTNGAVYVFADPDLGESIARDQVLHAEDHGPLTVASAKQHSDRLVVSFVGVSSRHAAEELRGTVLTTPRDTIELEEGMIWIADLQGRQVVDADGGLVGVVETVRDGHAHDYLVVARPDGGQALLPMVPEIVDYSGDPVIVTPPPGLLNPDEAL